MHGGRLGDGGTPFVLMPSMVNTSVATLIPQTKPRCTCEGVEIIVWGAVERASDIVGSAKLHLDPPT